MNFYALIGTLSLAILALLIYGICDFARYLRQERESQELRDLEQRNQERLDLIDFWFSAGRRQGVQEEACRRIELDLHAEFDKVNLKPKRNRPRKQK